MTDTNGIAPELKGTVNIVADTKIGDVPISGIPFNVTSEIKGKRTCARTKRTALIFLYQALMDSAGSLEYPTSLSLEVAVMVHTYWLR